MKAGETPLLLTIDDDPDQLTLFGIAALRAGGLRLIAAESGTEALIQLEARAQSNLARPDLVLTDLKMPDMSGIELMRRLRCQPGLENIPVIFLTSSVYGRDRIAAHIAGANGFFEKPARFPDLVRLLQSLPSYLTQHDARAGRPLSPGVDGLNAAPGEPRIAAA